MPSFLSTPPSLWAIALIFFSLPVLGDLMSSQPLSTKVLPESLGLLLFYAALTSRGTGATLRHCGALSVVDLHYFLIWRYLLLWPPHLFPILLCFIVLLCPWYTVGHVSHSFKQTNKPVYTLHSWNEHLDHVFITGYKYYMNELTEIFIGWTGC